MAQLVDDSTVRRHRDRNTNLFAIGLVGLWLKLRAQHIDQAHFHDQYSQLWTDHAGKARSAASLAYDVAPDILAAATALVMARLTTAAAGMALRVVTGLISKQRQYSMRQLTAAADQVAGKMWAVHFAQQAAAYEINRSPVMPGPDGLLQLDLGPTRVRWLAVGDFRTCSGCDVLNGQEWDITDDYPLPGDGGTPCQGNCRCELEFYGIRGESAGGGEQAKLAA